jgi:2,3-bisphosphoglycerate-independent phosphoglycerate mutase
VNAVDRLAGHHKQRLSVAPVVLAILDGWGDRDSSDFNAIRSAETPVMDALKHAYPNTLIQASGSHVGLPDGQMGNSEVGHLTIGAGRIIRQELVRIGDTVRTNQLPAVPALTSLAERLRESGRTLHLLGLCSDGGVHSHVDHLCGLLRWAAAEGIQTVAIHAITDGRDTPTQSAPRYVHSIEEAIQSSGIGEIVSLCGRYWANAGREPHAPITC